LEEQTEGGGQELLAVCSLDGDGEDGVRGEGGVERLGLEHDALDDGAQLIRDQQGRALLGNELQDEGKSDEGRGEQAQEALRIFQRHVVLWNSFIYLFYYYFYLCFFFFCLCIFLCVLF